MKYQPDFSKKKRVVTVSLFLKKEWSQFKDSRLLIRSPCYSTTGRFRGDSQSTVELVSPSPPASFRHCWRGVPGPQQRPLCRLTFAHMSIIFSSLQAILNNIYFSISISSGSLVTYIYYLSQQSSWCCCSHFGGSISFWFIFSSDGSEMPTILEASDSIIIADVRTVRSTFQLHIEFDMLFVVQLKNYNVSSSMRCWLQAASSTSSSASPCSGGPSCGSSCCR
jgi:hypothetical protein